MTGHPADHPGPLAFVVDVEHPELAAPDEHHLRRVLRLRRGAPLTVADGRGRWRTARLDDALEVTGPVEELPRRERPLTVGFALTKGDKPELVVQKLTELGIDRIAPLRAERSVVRWDADKAAKAEERLRQVARAAAEQSHRPRWPEVTEVLGLAALVERLRVEGAAVAMAQRSGPSVDGRVDAVLVGPEGGWSEAELALGLAPIGLGEHVLRAETAAIAAGVLLSAHRP